MKDIEINEGNGIFQDFEMEKVFYKESLLDTLYTQYTAGNISDKAYRMSYKLKNRILY